MDDDGDGVEQCYYFDGNGYMLADTTTPDGCTVNGSGAWVENGAVQTRTAETVRYPANEFDRAAWYGFLPEELSGMDKSAPVTWKQFCGLLGRMIQVWDAGQYDAWCSKTAQAPDIGITWDGAMLALFEAARLLDAAEMNAESNAGYDYMNPQLYPLLDGQAIVHVEESYGDQDIPKWNAAVQYSARRVSCVSGHELIEPVQKQVDLSTPLDLQTAVCAAVRLYESVPEHLPEAGIIDTQESGAWEAAFLNAADQRIAEIINNSENFMPEQVHDVYYISNRGNDANDGKSPARAWATLERINQSYLQPNDVVCFERGGLWRGKLESQPAITYTTYGEGPKPIITCSPADGSGAENWTLYGHSSDGGLIWQYAHEIGETGGIILGDTNTIARRVFAWYDGKNFYNTWNNQIPFQLENELLWDLSFYCAIEYPQCELPFQANGNPGDFSGRTTIFLRCDAGNPGEVYDKIEFMSTQVDRLPFGNIRLEEQCSLYNLSIQYFGARAVMLDDGCTVKYCDIGYGSGIVYDYFQPGEDQCGIWIDASAIFFQASDVTIENNYIHDVEDHAVTLEIGGDAEAMRERAPFQNNVIRDNVVRRCNGGIYWANNQGEIQDIEVFGPSEIRGNYLMETGYGWYADRLSNMDPGAALGLGRVALDFGGSYCRGIRGVRVEDNVFYRADFHLVTTRGCIWQNGDMPYFHGHTYAQDVGHGLIHDQSAAVRLYDKESARNYLIKWYRDEDFEVYLLK